ncbi:Brca1-associated protein [Thalictrum thalictroides]|uniref:Brca1-associated protein n=1 Tax=Thalictrum thalictroides TaxID=46969 RepID=A0A7J6WC67_THATH|nr:Brca1-associated protein [Thalictrum thalictroides]
MIKPAFADFRYKERHAIQHWIDTQHCYSLDLETQEVWDYVGDTYVHRLNHSKTDGKLAEMNSYCRERSIFKSKDEQIDDLEEQIRDITVYVKTQKVIDKMSDSESIKGGTVLPVPLQQSSASNSKRR